MTKQAAHPGAPEGYPELHAYFGSVSERAEALGVERDTVRTWDERRASRLRRSSQERVRGLLAVCRELQALMPDPPSIGRWLLTEQPGLRGAKPNEVLLRLGATGQTLVAQVAHGVAAVRPGDLPDSESFWRAVEGKLSARELAQIRDTGERVEGFTGSLSLA